MITCLSALSDDGEAVVMTNLTQAPTCQHRMHRSGSTRCGCRRWVCRQCLTVVHRARPLPRPATHGRYPSDEGTYQ